MAKSIKSKTTSVSPSCGGTGSSGSWGPGSEIGIVKCAVCGGTGALSSDSRDFYAHGAESMEAQVAIVNYYHKMAALRAVASYFVSAVFAIVAGALIVFAPESRTVAANLVAGAFVVLAAGIAGFTRFKAKAPGLDISGDQSRGKTS